MPTGEQMQPMQTGKITGKGMNWNVLLLHGHLPDQHLQAAANLLNVTRSVNT